MKATILGAIACLAAVTSSYGTVTINFNAPFTGGVSSNLANSAGVVSNGLFWGIIVDTTGNGFLTSYDAGLNLALNQNLQLGSSDDRLVVAGDLTSDTSGFLEGDITTPGGPGGVTAVADLALANGITTGDAFRLVWFGSNTQGGFLTSGTFTIPADGGTVDYDSVFVGVDPVRAAVGLSFVPEPSVTLLGALGLLGFFRRRR